MSPDTPAMTDAELAAVEHGLTELQGYNAMSPAARYARRLLAELKRLHTWAGLISLLDKHYPADVFDGSSGDPGPCLIALTREVERLRDVETHLRATIADAASAIGQDMERDEELARLRKANKDLAKLSMRTMERAAKAEERLSEIGETAVEWGVQWVDRNNEPYGLHWNGKDEAVQTYTRNHVNGNGDAQLLHRLVGQPRIADVEIVSNVPQGLNCWCPHELMPDGKLVRDGVVAAGCPAHDVEQDPRLACGCLGSCEGGPECLDDEGGPWLQGVPE